MKSGYIKVQLDYAPKTNGKKFSEWCEQHGFVPIGSGRRAWCSEYNTYLRDGLGVAYTECGESFIFYVEDLLATPQPNATNGMEGEKHE